MFFPRRGIIIFGGLFLSSLLCCARHEKSDSLRIVSLSPAMTEILFSLGAGDKIVGATTFCDHPPEAKKITRVGDFSHPSIERIIALKPDLVIVHLPEQRRIKEELNKLRMKIFSSSPHSLSEIYAEISALGRAIELDKQSDSLVAYMKANLEAVTTKHRKRIYLEISPRPIVTIGGSTFLDDLIYRAGGINVFADLNKDYPVVTQESVITRDPELIIVLHPESITGRTGWQKIEAIEKGRVYTDLDPDLFMRPAPRLIQGFQRLKEIIND